MKISKFLVLLVTLILFLSLIACQGGQALVNRAEALGDLRIHLDYAAPINVEVKDLRILDRRTSRKEGVDQVLLEALVSTEGAECLCHYLFQYQSTGATWILREVTAIDKPEWNFTPLAGPSLDLVEYTLRSREGVEGSQLLASDVNLKEGTAAYLFAVEENYPYMSRSGKLKILFKFDPYWAEWDYANSVHEDLKEVWDVEGTWTLYRSVEWDFGYVVDFRLDIRSFDGKTLEGEYSLRHLTRGQDNRLNEKGPFSSSSSSGIHPFDYKIDAHRSFDYGFSLDPWNGVQFHFIETFLRNYYPCERVY